MGSLKVEFCLELSRHDSGIHGHQGEDDSKLELRVWVCKSLLNAVVLNLEEFLKVMHLES